jgi:hypothetical protein
VYRSVTARSTAKASVVPRESDPTLSIDAFLSILDILSLKTAKPSATAIVDMAE